MKNRDIQEELFDKIQGIFRDSVFPQELKVKGALIPEMVIIENNVYAGTMERLVKEFDGLEHGICFVNGELMVY